MYSLSHPAVCAAVEGDESITRPTLGPLSPPLPSDGGGMYKSGVLRVTAYVQSRAPPRKNAQDGWDLRLGTSGAMAMHIEIG